MSVRPSFFSGQQDATPNHTGCEIHRAGDFKTSATPVANLLFKMNVDLASRKSNLSETELKKKFRSLISQIQGQAKRSSDSFPPQNFAWFHRKQAETSVEARKECLAALQADLDNLK